MRATQDPTTSAEDVNQDDPLLPPNSRQFSSLSPSIGALDSARDSVVSDDNSAQPIARTTANVPLVGGGAEAKEYGEYDAGVEQAPRSKRRKWLLIGCLCFVIVAAAIAVPLGVVLGRKNSSSSSSGSSSGSGGSGSGGKGATSGGNGSTVTTEDGSTFIYINQVSPFSCALSLQLTVLFSSAGSG